MLRCSAVVMYGEKEMGPLVDRACLSLLEHRCILLSGPVGVGKTTLARGIIRSLCPELSSSKIPSPSFSLMIPYISSIGVLWHIDLYRLSSEEGWREAEAMGLREILENDYALIEWPERLSPSPQGMGVRLDFSACLKKRRAIFCGISDSTD